MDGKSVSTNTGVEDFSSEDLQSLEDYEKKGCPGLERKVDSDFFQWFQLYMSGKSYTEIAKITSSKKDMILYASKKGQWHSKKMQYYSDLNDTALQKYSQSKLESLNTVTTMISALNKYFGGKFDKYLKTNDSSIIESLDTKLLAQYYKATETMDKIVGASLGKDDEGNRGNGKQPLVNINMTGSNKVTQTDENTIEIEADETDKEKAVAEVLASLSKLKKIRASDDD